MGTSRRKFLEAAGRIAVYTPPAMLAMSQPSFAEIQKSGGAASYPTSTLSLQRQDVACTNRDGPETKNFVARFCRIF
ncbi:MAG TPA: hypothetical protein VMR74_17015 [Gammaproteobacteria bacterium]|nr:hypothetical protein [Gammaproteobacteria bacterium]